MKVFFGLLFLCFLVFGIYTWVTNFTDKAVALLAVSCGLAFLSTHIL